MLEEKIQKQKIRWSVHPFVNGPKEVEHTNKEAAEMLDILEHGTLSSELEQTRGLSCKW
jgi:hypothetical protein